MTALRMAVGPLMQQSAPAFSPDDIAGLAAWYDASDESTITDTGGAVTAWADKSGNGNHASAVSGNAITGTRTINGLNTLDLDTDIVSLYTPSTATLTIFVVAQTDLAFGGKRLLTSYDGAGALVPGEFILDGVPTNKVRWLLGNTGNVSTANNAVTVSSPFLLTAQNVAGTSALVRVDGAETTLGTGHSTAPIRPLLLGEDSAGAFAEYWDGPIAEIIIYEAALSGAQITQVEDYLTTKWGL